MRVFLFFAISAALMAAGYPKAEISNGLIRARLYLPSPGDGSYQGTRFDWSGIIYSLQYSGHEYFGQWYEKHDPKIHDAITGPVEEFRTNEAGLGYDEAPAGGTFVRIGAGVVRKPDEPAYQLFKTYEIVDPGKWSIRKGADWIEFTQRLKSPDGYAYEYRKTVRLLKGQPRMALEHTLRNTGKRAIETTQYNHNFFVIDGETVGPDVAVKFGFDAKPARDLKGLATVRDRQLTYTHDLEKGQSLLTELEGFGQTASDYDFRIENRKSGAGVHISGDQPLTKLVFWCIRTVACPEPYIRLRVEPGEEKKWQVAYEFYTLK